MNKVRVMVTLWIGRAYEDIKYIYHEHMALAAKKFWGGTRKA
jgi:hypothetical protein